MISITIPYWANIYITVSVGFVALLASFTCALAAWELRDSKMSVFTTYLGLSILLLAMSGINFWAALLSLVGSGIIKWEFYQNNLGRLRESWPTIIMWLFELVGVYIILETAITLKANRIKETLKRGLIFTGILSIPVVMWQLWRAFL